MWGSPTAFPIQIDTQPPAVFTPVSDLVQNKLLVSFFTTDALSGVDHYEVATVDSHGPAIASPVFIQAESPYQLAIPGPGSYHITVRAFDRAGNIRDISTDFTVSVPWIQWAKNNDLALIIVLLLFIILLFILHYFFGHKLIRRVHRAMIAIEEESRREKIEEAQETLHETASQENEQHSETGEYDHGKNP